MTSMHHNRSCLKQIRGLGARTSSTPDKKMQPKQLGKLSCLVCLSFAFLVPYSVGFFILQSPRLTSAVEGDDSVVLRHVAHGHNRGTVHRKAGQAVLQVPPGIVGGDAGAVLVSHRQQGRGPACLRSMLSIRCFQGSGYGGGLGVQNTGGR